MLRARNSTTSRVPAARVTTNLGVARLANDSFSTVWNDLSPNGYNGEDHTGGTWPFFDGVGDYVLAPPPYVKGGVGEPPLLPITADLTTATVEAWCKPSGLAATMRVISLHSAASLNSLSLGVRNTGLLFFQVNNTIRADGLSPLVVGTWVHVVCVAATGSAPVLYVNGVDDTGAASSSAYPYSPSQIGIGATLYSAPLATSQPFHGDIDTVRVYERILSPDEVLMNYNAGLAAHQ